MSLEISTACWQVTGISGTEKCVLMALADHANDAGICWPSVARIVELTCFSERAVQSALKSLADRGLIVRSVSRGGRTTEYRINPAATAPVSVAKAEKSTPQHAQKTPHLPHPAAAAQVQQPRLEVQLPHPNPAAAAPGTVKNHQEPPSNKRTTAKTLTTVKRPDDVTEEIWNEFKAHRSKLRAILTERVVNEFRAEAEAVGWTLSQAMQKAMNRGWRGFERGWIKPGELPPGATPGNGSPPSTAWKPPELRDRPEREIQGEVLHE